MIDGWCDPVDPATIPPAWWDGWEATYSNDCERGKRTTRHLDRLPAMLPLFARLNAPETVAWVYGLVGYPVIPDPTMHGGGVHVSTGGSWLQTHLDYSAHGRLPGWRRAVNLIAFLNPEWRAEWGGALILADTAGRPAVKVYPAPGRLVAFETHGHSFHGVEQTAADAPDRHSAAVYYLAADGREEPRSRAMFLPNRQSGRAPAEVSLGVEAPNVIPPRPTPCTAS